jgi:hypothetical protein
MPHDRRPDADEVRACREHLTAVLFEVWDIAERGGPDFSAVVAEALQELSAGLGGAGTLTRSRPGSWEAAAVTNLAASIDDDWGVGL